MSSHAVLLAVLCYGAALFAGAIWVQRRRDSLNRSPLRQTAYTLSLAVYCTSWTYYGAVGTAVSSGWAYVPICLGPILLFLVAPRFLRRLVEAVREEGATSLSDFLAARFGKSRGLAALVTVLALAGTVPYIGLQLRSVGVSYSLLTGGGTDLAAPVAVAALALAVFAIAFGTRSYASGRYDAAVQFAVAAESLVKLLALCAAAVFALVLLLRAPPQVASDGWAALGRNFAPDRVGLDLPVITLLSMLAIICLPRQFYVAVLQAREPDHIVRARVPFMAYLAVTIVAVIPVAAAGLGLLPRATNPDFLMLAVPMAAGADALTLAVFLGGLSAVTAMVATECIALSTMVANDLVGPLLLRRGQAAGNLGHVLLFVRRAAILLLLGAGAFYALNLPVSANLASVGLIAFAGLAQTAPGLIHAVYRSDGDPDAVLAGLIAGLFFWGYLLFLPSIGLGHPDWLDPGRALGMGMLNPVVQGTLLSLGSNLLCFAIVMLLRQGRTVLRLPFGGLRHVGSVTSMGELMGLVARFAGPAATERSFPRIDPDARIDPVNARRAERLIARVVGASAAHSIMGSALSGASLGLADIAKLLDASAQNLHFSRELLAATLENIDTGVSVIDRDQRLIAWNSRYLDLFDYPPGMARIGAPLAELIRYNAARADVAADDIDDHVQRRLNHMRAGTPHSFERRWGDGRVLRAVGGPMPDGGYVMCFTDITAETQALKNLETARAELEARVKARTAELSQANDKLARATAEKTRFLAAASHDLLQPLHAARLFAASLRRDLPNAALPALERVDQSIAAANDLLRALLDISKLDAGGIVPHVQPVPLRPLIADLVESFAPLAAQRGLYLRLAPGDGTVETDPTLLRSIVQNFLSNALRYTRVGGVVVGVRRRGDRVRIDVCDSGSGIPEDKREAIFREFERLGNGDATGIGLGLAIVERTARLLGAHIDLASHEGRGSRFSVSLPAVNSAPAAVPSPGRSAADGTPRPRDILVVDDDAPICAAMAMLLGGEGHRVATAASAEEALGLSGPFDLALIDYNLGEGMNGVQLGRTLRARFAGLSVALVTAEQDAAILKQAAEAGLTLLAKPLAADTLHEWIAAAG